jgi:hypothetical protein
MMAQRRMISKSLGSSRKFHSVRIKCGKLGDFAQALFPLIVVSCDDFGRLEGDAFTIKHKVFPISPYREEEFEIVLQAMNEVGLVRLYFAGGDRFLEVVNFDREQPNLNKRTKSEFPDPQVDFGISKNILEIPLEPNLTKPNLTEPNSTAADAALSKSSEVLVEIYKAENKVLPDILEFTKERRKQCRTRLAKNPDKFIDQFTRAVIKAQETPFLRGEGSQGWRADFDWFISNDRNVVKVMEGKYDQNERASPGNNSVNVFEKLRREQQEGGKHGSDRVA